MNRIGMIIDISHVSDKTFYDTLAITSKPVIASHSSCRALSDVPRNMSDDMIRALGKNGGVIGINVGYAFLRQEGAEALRKSISRNLENPDLTGKALDNYASEEYRREYGPLKVSAATVDDVARHIDHAVKLAGVDHVGIGTDFDGIESTPKGFEDASKFPNLRAALKKLGYADRDIDKIFGLNHLRVMRTVVGR
jgi:membrane dipeptidase